MSLLVTILWNVKPFLFYLVIYLFLFVYRRRQCIRLSRVDWHYDW
jgi:hypothetical protein